MPTLNYTPGNTPPSGIALPSETPDNTAPDGIALGSMAGTGASPSAHALAASTPDNTPPAAHTLASTTPDNGAPATITLPASTPSNAAPAAVAGAGQTPGNGAPAAIPRASEMPDNGIPGTVPGAATLTAAPNEVPRPIGYIPNLTPSTDDNVNTPTLVIPGALALNSTYGQTRIAAACGLERVQLALESAPLGGDVTVALVDGSGTSYGVTVTVPAGQTFGETIPGAPVALGAGANIRAKCTATPGGADPGGFGVVTLFTRIVN